MEQTLLELQHEDGRHVIKVKLVYELGGMSYLAGQQIQRGYYLFVTPMEISHGMTLYSGWSGVRTLIEPAKRKSVKHFNQIANAENVWRPLMQKMLTQARFHGDLSNYKEVEK